MKKEEKNQGITVIALVITIIVLLILAAITLATLTGDNGIINKGKDARRDSEINEYREQLEVLKNMEIGKDYTLNVNEFIDNYAEAVKKDEMFKDATVEKKYENESVIVTTKEGYVFEVTIDDIFVNDDGTGSSDIDISEVTITINLNPNTWTNGKVKATISSNARNITKEYSLDGTKWEKYTGEIEVENNGTKIYARGKNAENETTEVVEKEVTNIDRLAPKEFTPEVESGINTINVKAETEDRAATQIDGESGIKSYQFSKDNGGTWSEERTTGEYIFTDIEKGKNYQIKVKAKDKAGNETESKVVTGGTVEIPGGNESIKISANPTTWTNGKVKVTIETEYKEYGIEYSIDGEGWQKYTKEIEVEDNGQTVYARLTYNGESGEEASKTIGNIDRLEPKEFTPTVSTTTNTVTVKAEAEDAEANAINGKSGIQGYKFSTDGSNWTEIFEEGEYTLSGLESGKEYKIYVKAIDNAGNEMVSDAVTGRTGSIPGGNSNITMSKDPENWTNGTVQVNATSNHIGEYVLQYSLDGNNYEKYNGPITVRNNGQKVYAALNDGTQRGEPATITVDNIDTLVPNKFTPTITGKTNNSITVNASNATDAPATGTSGSSGIEYYQYSRDGMNWSAKTTSSTYTIGNLVPGETYDITVKVIDRAGNENTSNIVQGSTEEIPGGSNAINISYTPSYWTNRDVTVTIKALVSGYELQYSKTGNSNDWHTYTSPVLMKENGIIYARLVDTSGNHGDYATSNISNIDKNPPTSSYTLSKSGDTDGEVTININASDGYQESGIGSITNTTYENITKLSMYTYTVTQNGTYTFEIKDVAGNAITQTVTVNNIVKKLRVGDYVDYTPEPTEIFYTIKQQYAGRQSIVKTDHLSTSSYRVLDVRDDGIVELIADKTTSSKIQFYGALGYNNGVYLLNNTCEEMYSNSRIGAKGRSVKSEDITDKIDTSKYDYTNYIKFTPNKNYKYGEPITAENSYYPATWKLEKSQNNKINGVATNGTLGMSEQNELTTEEAIGPVSNYEAELKEWENQLPANYFLPAETKQSLSDTNIYCQLFNSNNDYYLATRATSVADSTFFVEGPYFGFLKVGKPSASSLGVSSINTYESEDNTGFVTEYYMRAIIEIPMDSINLGIGNGDQLTPWGTK